MIESKKNLSRRCNKKERNKKIKHKYLNALFMNEEHLSGCEEFGLLQEK